MIMRHLSGKVNLLEPNQILRKLIEGTFGSLPTRPGDEILPPVVPDDSLPTAAQILTRLVLGEYGSIPIRQAPSNREANYTTPNVLYHDLIIPAEHDMRVHQRLVIKNSVHLKVSGRLVLD